MLPDPNPVRRRRSRVESTDAAARRSSPAAPSSRRLVAAFGVATALLASLAAAPAEATAAVADLAFEPAAPTSVARAAAARTAERADAGVIVRVAPIASTTVTPGAPLTLEVEVENATAEPIPAGTIRLVRSNDSIDDVAELDAWLGQVPSEAEPDGDETVAAPHALEGMELSLADSPPLAPGALDVVSFTLPPDALDSVEETPVLGLGVELLVDGALAASATDAYASSAAAAADPVSLALAYPMTVPVSATGLLTAEDLATWTTPFGLLTRQLDAVAGRQVAVGIDPRIIASITALGTAAPPSALAWLERLAELPNEVFPLAYADADVAVQAQVGLPAPLVPTSFTDVLDPAAFADTGAGDADEGAGGGAGEGPDATPAPTVEPTEPVAGELPTTEQLLAWPYTRTDLAWPADDTIAAGNLGFLAAAGMTTAILAPGNVVATESWSNAASNVDGATAVVADSRLTAPLRDASEALTDTEWRAATGQIGAELALGAARNSAQPLTVLATFDRGAGTQATRVAATLDELAANPLARPASLSDAIGAPPVERALIELPEGEQRRANVDRLVRAEADVGAFATVLEDPRLISGPARRDVLALLDVAWLEDREGWDAAVGQWLLAQRSTLGAVTVVPSSPINVVSSETGVPTTILNALPYPVKVVVDVDPSNGRLIVEDQMTVTVDPESRSLVRVPVAAGIGNGEVTLTVTLASPEGVPIGGPVMIPANVQADWEGLGAAILGFVLVVFFGVGVWRNIRRLRRQRAEAAAAAEAPEAAATPEAPDAPAAADEPAAADTAVSPGEPDTERRDG